MSKKVTTPEEGFAELRKSFLGEIPETVNPIRKILEEIFTSESLIITEESKVRIALRKGNKERDLICQLLELCSPLLVFKTRHELGNKLQFPYFVEIFKEKDSKVG